jgi:hypothetical protein
MWRFEVNTKALVPPLRQGDVPDFYGIVSF